jgi:hypothetical protein
MKYRKKPVVVEAIRFTGANLSEIESLTNAVVTDGERVFIQTLEGDMLVTPGDMVIKGIAGECYPCKPDIFEATYEPA